MDAPEVPATAPHWALKQACPQGEMVRRIVTHVSNTHHFKDLLVHHQDLVSTLLQQYTLTNLGPRIQVSEHQVLAEVLEEVHQTKIHP